MKMFEKEFLALKDNDEEKRQKHGHREEKNFQNKLWKIVLKTNERRESSIDEETSAKINVTFSDRIAKTK